MAELPPTVAKLIADASDFVAGMTRAKGSMGEVNLAMQQADLTSRRMAASMESAAQRSATASKRAADAAAALAKAQDAAAAAAERFAAGTASQEESAAAATKATEAETVALEAQARAALAAERAAIAQAQAQLSTSRQIIGASAEQEAAAERTGSSWSRAGEMLTKLGTIGSLAITGVAAESLKMATQFDSTMELLHTQAGASQQEVNNLKGAVLGLAGAVGQGPEQLAEALYHIESDGYRASAAMDILTLAAKGAAVSGANLDDTTYSLVSTMKALGDSGIAGATKDMATLNAIVGAGDMKFSDLNGAITTGILGTMQTFGVSLKSTGAALDFLTQRGEPAQQSATRLAMGLTLLAAPSAQASKLLAQVGLTSQVTADQTNAVAQALEKSGLSTTKFASDLKKPDGVYVAISDLNSHLQASGISAELAAALISRAFGGGRTGKSIEQMATDVMGIQDAYNQVSKGTSQFGEAVAANAETLKQKWHVFMADMQVDAINVGHALEPVAAGAITGFEAMGRAVEGTVKFLKDNAIAVGIVGAAYAALNFSAIAGRLSDVSLAFEGVRLKGLAVADSLRELGSGSLVMGGIVGGVALAGVAALALGIQSMFQKAKEALPAVADLTSAMKANDMASQVTSFLNSLQGSSSGDSSKESVLEYLERYKVNLQQLFSAVEDGDKSKVSSILDGVLQSASKGGASVTTIAQIARVVGDLTNRYGDAKTALAALNDANVTGLPPVQKLTAAQQAYKKAQDELNAAVKAGNPMAAEAASRAEAIAKAQETASKSAGVLATAQTDLSKAMSGVATTLAQQVDFFKGVSDASTVTKDTLIKNAQDTITAFSNEATNVGKLSQEGLSGTVIKGLVAQGPTTVAAAATMSPAQIKNYNEQYVLQQQASQRAQLAIVKATQPEIYQEYVDAAKQHAGDVAAAQKAVFVDSFQKVAQQVIGMAQVGGDGVPDKFVQRILAGKSKVIDGMTQSFTAPQQAAVATLEALASSGGSGMAANMAAAIANGTPIVVSKQEALKDGINAQTALILRSIGITVTVTDYATATLRAIEGAITDIGNASAAAGGVTSVADYAERLAAGARAAAASKSHASGGYVRGPGTATSDSIPARLSDGEFVVKAAATRHNLPLLHAINNGYAEGGPVGFAAGGSVGRLNAAEKAYLASLNLAKTASPATAAFLQQMAAMTALVTRQSTIDAYTAQRYAAGQTTQADVPHMQYAAQVATGDYQQALAYFNAHKGALEATYNSKSSTAAQKSAALAVYNQLQGNVTSLRTSATDENKLAQTMRAQYAGREATVNTPGAATRDWSYLAVHGGTAGPGANVAHISTQLVVDGKVLASAVSKQQLTTNKNNGYVTTTPQIGIGGKR